MRLVRALILAAVPACSANGAELRAELQPLASLVSHCWMADLGEGKRDVQCFQPMYGGAMVQNTHMVLGTQPRYEGLTVYSWDGENRRIRFHYFTSTGAVSEGYAVPGKSGLSFPERHVDSDGKLTEVDTQWQFLGGDSYQVITRQKQDGQWRDGFKAEYRRIQGGGSSAGLLPLQHEGGQWTLAWNRETDQTWNAVFRATDGSLRPVSAAEADVGEGAHWLWDRHGEQLLMLCRSAAAGETPGWRACRARLAGARQRLNELPLGDGLLSCRQQDCLIGAQRDGRRRLIRSTTAGELLAPLFQGDWDDADPQYSPDGSQLLFRSNRSGSWELWLAQADGSSLRQLTDDSNNDGVPSHHYGGEGPARFAPNGEWIVWVRRFPNAGFDVWRMELGSGQARNLTLDHAGDDAYPAVSPDGRWIAFDSTRDSPGESEIFVMPSEGGAAQRISWSPGPDLAPLWIPLPEKHQ